MKSSMSCAERGFYLSAITALAGNALISISGTEAFIALLANQTDDNATNHESFAQDNPWVYCIIIPTVASSFAVSYMVVAPSVVSNLRAALGTNNKAQISTEAKATTPTKVGPCKKTVLAFMTLFGAFGDFTSTVPALSDAAYFYTKMQDPNSTIANSDQALLASPIYMSAAFFFAAICSCSYFAFNFSELIETKHSSDGHNATPNDTTKVSRAQSCLAHTLGWAAASIGAGIEGIVCLPAVASVIFSIASYINTSLDEINTEEYFSNNPKLFIILGACALSTITTDYNPEGVANARKIVSHLTGKAASTLYKTPLPLALRSLLVAPAALASFIAPLAQGISPFTSINEMLYSTIGAIMDSNATNGESFIQENPGFLIIPTVLFICIASTDFLFEAIHTLRATLPCSRTEHSNTSIDNTGSPLREVLITTPDSDEELYSDGIEYDSDNYSEPAESHPENATATIASSASSSPKKQMLAISSESDTEEGAAEEIHTEPEPTGCWSRCFGR